MNSVRSSARAAGAYATVLTVVCSRWAEACPFCETATSRRINAGIFDASFRLNLLRVLLPFAVLVAVVVGMVLLLPVRQARQKPAAPGQHEDGSR